MADDDLRDFERTEFTHDGTTRTVFRRGTGPAVIVIAEIPGITPKVLDFARKVADLGCTAVLPHLFGIPGLDPNASNLAALKAMGSALPSCISKEFTILATGKTSPVVDWLRALARAEHERCGGPGVGAIGMCFTGGYALAMATDDVILAGFAAQPEYKGKLKVVGKGFTDEYYGVGVPKGDDDMVAKVNAALQQYIADGSWRAALDQTVGPSGYSIPGPPTPGSV